MQRFLNKYWLVVVAAIIAVIGASVLFQRDPAPSDGPIVFATGSQEGMYNALGLAMRDAGITDASLRITGGTSENLDLLRAREVQFALVQNDLAQYSALGIRGRTRFDELNYVLAVFPEFVQVLVPNGSELRVFNDLRGQQICVGSPGSGTYYNSIDILAEAGLREGVDYIPIARPSFECIDELANGMGDDMEEGEATGIAAVFLTSNRQVAREDERFRQLVFSDSLSDALAAQHQYFRVIRPDDDEAIIVPQLAVDAYLATHADLPQATVAALTNRIIEGWGGLQQRLPNLPPLQVPDVRETIPYHPGSDGELEEAGLKTFDWLSYFVFVPWALLFIAATIVEGWKFSYNRLGENPYSLGWRRHAMRLVGAGSRHFIALSFLGVGIIAAMFLLRWLEDQHALAQGSVSPFAQLDLYDSFVWLFTYVGNGFTADDIYPVSFVGKVMVGVLAVVGFTLPIGAIFWGINVSAKKAERAQEGLGYPDFTGHVVICGWNEKASGIISTLTGKDVPTRKKVVIVAQPEDRFPIEKFKFNDRFVAFCRGSPADEKVLRRARTSEADSVIVLADFAGNQTLNKGSILAAMNVRKLNPDAHVCAELEYIDNADLLASVGCQTMVYNQLVACRAATTAILSMDLIDFVLDCVTYHDSAHDELYSVSASKVIDHLQHVFKRRKLETVRVSDLRHILARRGVNVVGVIDDTYREAAIDAAFIAREEGTLVDAKFRNRPLKRDATIVYAAQKQDHIFQGRKGTDAHPVSSAHFFPDYPREMTVLVCSGPHTLETVEAELRAIMGEGLTFVGVDLSEERPRSLAKVAPLIPDGLDLCLIMNTRDERTELDSLEDVNEADSNSMLLAGLFSKIREQRGESWPIIGEIGNRQNADLLKTAGADHALPVSMLVERFMAKEIYDHNHVVDYLMAAMKLSDGVHMIAHTVREGDGFCGERYDALLATQIDGIRLLGWRPKAAMDDLRNRDGDFGYHYRMVFDARIANETAAPGDTLILMLRDKPTYPAAPIV